MEGNESEGQVEQVEQVEAPQEGTPIFRGIQRDIADPRELAEYALSLERQTLEQQARLAGMGAPAAEAPRTPQAEDDNAFYKTVSEEFIIAPQTAIKRIEDRIFARVNGEVEGRIGLTEFYRSFYDENEDLVGCEDLVQMALDRNRERWKRVPTAQAKKLLADEVRNRVNTIRGTAAPGRERELPTRGAPGLAASGNPARPVNTQKKAPEGPTTLAGAIKAQRARQGRH